ncbi:TPA: hypothetical protein I9Z34_003062 [Clostridium perfringens]|nr:hypothetical protein [Clostridium perfringens]
MINVLNSIISAIASFFNAIICLLPKSPFNYIDNSGIKDFMGYLNYFIPVSTLISISEAWLVAIGIYYIYSIALRWIKAIE